MSDAVTLTASEAALWFAEKAHTGLLVALWLNQKTAEQLAVAGGEDAGNLHITLAYCGDASELGDLAVYRAVAAVEQAVQWWGTVDGKVSGYGRFNPTETSDDQSVFYASVDIVGLTELRQRVMEALYEAGVPPKTTHGFTPHITLAYLDNDATNPVDSVPSVALKFDGVTVKVGGKRIDIPFAPPPVAMFAVREETDSPALHVYQPLAFATPPEWAPFLPVPGTYNHPLYGELDFSPEVYARIVANFKNGTYQSTIPVNAEHDLSSSGAVGWITDMRVAENGAVDARVEWNDRGKALIEGDRFRYVSAEVFETWTDPVTGQEIPDVAVGLAICTNPYFKEAVLRPLAASEAVLTRVVASAAVEATEPETGAETPEESSMSDQETPSTTTTAPPEQFAETRRADPSARLDEAAAQEFAELRREKKRLEDENKQLAEDRARLLSASRVKRFTDEVRGHSDQNGKAYVGDIPDHVRMLCDVEEQFGAGSWHVQQYQTVCRAYAELAAKSDLYREIGTGRGNDSTNTAHDQIDALARELTRTNPALTHAQAFTQVLTTNAELRAAHARERQGGR